MLVQVPMSDRPDLDHESRGCPHHHILWQRSMRTAAIPRCYVERSIVAYLQGDTTHANH